MNAYRAHRSSRGAGFLLVLFGIFPTALAGSLQFVPFTYQDVKNPATNHAAEPGEHLRIEADGRVLFEGPAQDLLRSLNLVEEHYCALGQSLRHNGKLLLSETLTDPRMMYAQLMSDLGIEADKALEKVLPPLKECETVTLEVLGVNAKTLAAYLPNDKIKLGDGEALSAQDFVERINEQQRVACALGISLFDRLDGGGGDVVHKIMSSRASFMRDFNISKYLPRFNMQPLKRLRVVGEIAAEVASWVEKKTLPGFDRIKHVADKIGIHIPDNLKVPELPNIPLVDVPRRLDLKIKKNKKWEGINRGERNRFNVFANAEYEIRGNERNQEATAEGKAGVYIFDHEIRALQGTLQAYGGPDEVRAQLYLQALSYTTDREIRHEQKVYLAKEPVLEYRFDEGYQATFTVGPIPVGFAAGARARVFVGWELGVEGTELGARLGPGIDAQAFVEGVVGFAGFLSAGASAALKLIALEAGLSGTSALRWQSDGLPMLAAQMNAGVDYSALVGGVSAFVEYPAPRWGVPPWHAKRAQHTIFEWGGYYGSHRIMNWGIEQTPFQAKLSGELLDQTDRAEFQALNEQVDRRLREQELSKLENGISEREAAVFTSITNDLSSGLSVQVQRDQAVLSAQVDEIVAMREPYLRELVAVLKDFQGD